MNKNLNKDLKRNILLTGLIAAAVLFLAGCGDKFDAAGYTKAVLALTFQGETEPAMQYAPDLSKNDLRQQYIDSIDRFVAANITDELGVNDAKAAQFAELVSKIFTTMRYDVKEAQKTGKGEYEVPVEIEPSDVFVRFRQLLTEDGIKMNEKIKSGEYSGTEEEVAEQVMRDVVNHAYELLDVAAMDGEYEDPQTVVLNVTAGQDGQYAIDEDDMDTLIRKILCLDENGG